MLKLTIQPNPASILGLQVGVGQSPRKTRKHIHNTSQFVRLRIAEILHKSEQLKKTQRLWLSENCIDVIFVSMILSFGTPDQELNQKQTRQGKQMKTEIEEIEI